ncbi:hypothetical protein PLESTM_000343200 [Pleodorina starrii]|nr:hypothetical protein PLESTM_000343200 [Pleodorina starrii]
MPERRQSESSGALTHTHTHRPPKHHTTGASTRSLSANLLPRSLLLSCPWPAPGRPPKRPVPPPSRGCCAASRADGRAPCGCRLPAGRVGVATRHTRAVKWEVTSRRVDYKRPLCCCCGTKASTAQVRNIKDVDYRSCCCNGEVTVHMKDPKETLHIEGFGDKDALKAIYKGLTKAVADLKVNLLSGV